MQSKLILTPAQQAAANYISEHLSTANVIVLRGAKGSGKTTILKALSKSEDATLISAGILTEMGFLWLLRTRYAAAT